MMQTSKQIVLEWNSLLYILHFTLNPENVLKIIEKMLWNDIITDY